MNRLDQSPQAINLTPARAPVWAIILLLVAAALWSISGVAVKVIAVDSVTFAAWRSTGAAALMLLLLPLFRGSWPAAKWSVLSVVLYTLVVGLLITAMTYSTAAAGILLQYTAPVWCALFAWLLMSRRPSHIQIIAMLIAMGGIAFMLWGGGGSGGEDGGGRSTGILAPAAGLVSGVCFGALLLVLEKMNARSSGTLNPASIVLINNAGAAILLTIMAGFFGADLWIQPWKIAAICAVGMVQLALPYLLFQIALRHVPATTAGLLILLEPVLNPVWVALFTAEVPGLPTLIGGCCILAGLILQIIFSSSRSLPVQQAANHTKGRDSSIN